MYKIDEFLMSIKGTKLHRKLIYRYAEWASSKIASLEDELKSCGHDLVEMTKQSERFERDYLSLYMRLSDIESAKVNDGECE